MSIVQAIALDSLWTKTMDQAVFDFSNPHTALFWLKMLATLLVLVSVWISYVALAMRFLWTPSLFDIALPIFVGLVQFALIEFTAINLFGWWLITNGIVFLAILVGNQGYFRKARLDPRNAEFFDTIAPARWRDFLPHLVGIAFVLAVGVAALFVQPNVWISIALVVTILASYPYFLAMQNKFWNRSIKPSDTTDD